MYVLDTDVLSGLRKLPRDRKLLSWIQAQDPEALYVSVITIMEIERSIEQERRRNPPFALTLTAWLNFTLVSFAERVLPVTSDVAKRWGRMQIQLGRTDNDIAIAATALENGFQVASRNIRHFGTTGVHVINPFDPP